VRTETAIFPRAGGDEAVCEPAFAEIAACSGLLTPIDATLGPSRAALAGQEACNGDEKTASSARRSWASRCALKRH
jgi:hypothetical protein